MSSWLVVEDEPYLKIGELFFYQEYVVDSWIALSLPHEVYIFKGLFAFISSIQSCLEVCIVSCGDHMHY